MNFCPPKNHTSRSAPWATKTWKKLTKKLHWKGTIFFKRKGSSSNFQPSFFKGLCSFSGRNGIFNTPPKKSIVMATDKIDDGQYVNFRMTHAIPQSSRTTTLYRSLEIIHCGKPVAVYNHQKVCQKRLYCTVVPFRGCVMQRCKSCKASFNCKSLCWLAP